MRASDQLLASSEARVFFYYLTTKSFPSFLADNVYVKSLALALSRVPHADVRLIVKENSDQELTSIARPFASEWKHGRSLMAVVWIGKLLWSHKRSSRFGSSSEHVILFSNDPVLLIIAGVYKKLLGGNFVVASDWHMLFWQPLMKIILLLSDKAITTSNKLRSALIAVGGISSGNITTVHGGVALELFQLTQEKIDLRSSLALPAGYLVGYVGGFRTMGMEKGLLYALDALAATENVAINLILVGGTEDAVAYYAQAAADRKLTNRVRILGRQSTIMIARYEMAMDALLIPYPNTPHYEYGFPMKLYEYMAAQKPIVTTPIGLVDEVLGVRSHLVPFNDPRSFAALLDTLPDLASGERNGLYADIENYSWDAKAAAIMSALRR